MSKIRGPEARNCRCRRCPAGVDRRSSNETTYAPARVLPGGNVRTWSSRTTSNLGADPLGAVADPGADDDTEELSSDEDGIDELHAAIAPAKRAMVNVRRT
jgi:hypothetical protein